MTTSMLQLSETELHEILTFVAASSRLSELQSLHDSLRKLGRSVLELDEMMIGRCEAGAGSSPIGRCSNFDPMVSLTDGPAALPRTPCAGAAGSNACTPATATPIDYQPDTPAGRSVVCHRRDAEGPSLCIVSSAKGRSSQELSALLQTLLPYVDDAFDRLGPDRAAGDCPALTSARNDSTAGGAPVVSLTSREHEVLHWTAQGKGCWETGAIIGISERTVKFHLRNIYRKLDVVNRAQAVARAARINLLQ